LRNSEKPRRGGAFSLGFWVACGIDPFRHAREGKVPTRSVEKTVDFYLELHETWRIFPLANFSAILIYQLNPYSSYRNDEPTGTVDPGSCVYLKKGVLQAFHSWRLKKYDYGVGQIASQALFLLVFSHP
jgi:hypothetical protein